jgi:DNA-directed RNA polymerase specialized sigma24 family protein
MPPDSSFDALMTRIRAGDQGAAEQLHRRFVHRLIALARTRLQPRIRQKVDSEDIVQSVFRTFFRRHQEEQFEFDGWDDLWSLLAQITLRKCGNQFSYFKTQRRNVGREISPNASQGLDSWQAIARDPTPSEAMRLAETIELLMSKLK